MVNRSWGITIDLGAYMKNGQYLLFAGVIIGFIASMMFRTDSCSKVNEKIITRHDTLFIDKPVIIPKPTIVYKTIREISTVVDSLKWTEYVTLLDSVFIDSTREIPVNRYRDSLIADGARLDYTIETLGFLTKFSPRLITTTQLELVEKKWTASLGLSDKVNWKCGIGYRGWIAEMEFDKRFKFSEMYITKQIQF